ncbi:MAG: hypothetical protein WBP58_01050 [Chitinophagaceae bacterium]
MKRELTELFSWHGYKSGGVKIPFTDRGKPTDETIKTDLIIMIDSLVEIICVGDLMKVPKIFFVGGPGNGKTEALEYLCLSLFSKMEVEHEYFQKLEFEAKKGNRTIEFSADFGMIKRVKLVPDASVSYPELDSADSMLNDIPDLLDDECLYVCCINRGILHDVLQKSDDSVKEFFSILVSVNSSSDETQNNSWPFEAYLKSAKIWTAVWPMELSSLFQSNNTRSPFQQILSNVIANFNWEKLNVSLRHNGLEEKFNPFAINKLHMETSDGNSIIKIMEAYELLENRRLTFREALAFASYIMLGFEDEYYDGSSVADPEDRVVTTLETFRDYQEKFQGYVACYKLAMMQSEFRLFRRWPDLNEIVADSKWLKFIESKGNYSGLLAFCQLFTNPPIRAPKTDLSRLVDFIGDNLDPSMIDTDDTDSDLFRIIDISLQSSVSILSTTIQEFEQISSLDKEVLKFFVRVETELDEIRGSSSDARVNSTVERLSIMLKRITAVYIKRKLGGSIGLTPYSRRVGEYLSSQDESALKQFYEPIEGLLGIKRVFGTTQRHGMLSAGLNTTFGQPTLEESEIFFRGEIGYAIRIYAVRNNSCMQPVSKSLYLKLTLLSERDVERAIVLPFTFRLYNAIYDLRKGLKKGTLPREITATFDRMRSFLEGVMVHRIDEESAIVFPNENKVNVEDLKF